MSSRSVARKTSFFCNPWRNSRLLNLLPNSSSTIRGLLAEDSCIMQTTSASEKSSANLKGYCIQPHEPCFYPKQNIRNLINNMYYLGGNDFNIRKLEFSVVVFHISSQSGANVRDIPLCNLSFNLGIAKVNHCNVTLCKGDRIGESLSLKN